MSNDNVSSGILLKKWHTAQATSGRLSSGAHRVLMRLLEHHNRERGDCFPSIDTIAAGAYCSRRTVFRAIKELVTQGHIEKQSGGGRLSGGGGRSNVYRVRLINGDTNGTVVPTTSNATSNAPSSAKRPRTVTKMAVNGDNHGTKNGDKNDAATVTPLSSQPGKGTWEEDEPENEHDELTVAAVRDSAGESSTAAEVSPSNEVEEDLPIPQHGNMQKFTLDIDDDDPLFTWP